ncbi:hypothetical protein PoB_000032600 [Plakobranchus ocellatus]|uniref:Uncharacterized protein n=1 Tax=Plakobranchus ocellatus TaxID=259542 RepID=A0AAV3WSU0_9GAST|nr:hypothetical protein PoB_000032600 [Plakobranchus ocellatus]
MARAKNSERYPKVHGTHKLPSPPVNCVCVCVCVLGGGECVKDSPSPTGAKGGHTWSLGDGQPKEDICGRQAITSYKKGEFPWPDEGRRESLGSTRVGRTILA